MGSRQGNIALLGPSHGLYGHAPPERPGKVQCPIRPIMSNLEGGFGPTRSHRPETRHFRDPTPFPPPCPAYCAVPRINIFQFFLIPLGVCDIVSELSTCQE